MKLLKIILNVLIYLIIVVISINTIVGFINFNNIKENKKPLVVFKTDIYETDEKTVTCYRFGIYKIIVTSTEEKITYESKLWFNDDF
ncbi:MAG: hypothetical protein PHD10_02445 [Bacilli bacterium]|nr:hypothetical protein [Bacilli bacterium]MDD4607971.1 hypothetical protein [Bacilli bacterium]